MYECVSGQAGVCMTGVCMYETGYGVDVDDFTVTFSVIGFDASTSLYMAIE